MGLTPDPGVFPAIAGNDCCIGARFPGEEEAVVFLTHSGDVLLSQGDCWEEVCRSGILGSLPIDRAYPFSDDAVGLLASLEHLGVELA